MFSTIPFNQENYSSHRVPLLPSAIMSSGNDITQLQSILGACNVYHWFIYKFANMAHNLPNMVDKEAHNYLGHHPTPTWALSTSWNKVDNSCVNSPGPIIPVLLDLQSWTAYHIFTVILQ